MPELIPAARIKELSKMPKWQLANMHKANGGLMPLRDYLQWTKDELLRAVIEDEEHDLEQQRRDDYTLAMRYEEAADRTAALYEDGDPYA